MIPQDLNLPSKFVDFQDGQLDSILDIASSDKRFVLFSGPTGSGKTLMMIAVALLSGGRVLILTGKKSLQDQYMEDFYSVGLAEVRGEANYRCLALSDGGELTQYNLGARGRYSGCDKGPCKIGVECSLKRDGCLKYDAIRVANDSDIVITNYAYHLSTKGSKSLGNFDLIILDEAHCAGGWVEKFNVVEIEEKDLSRLIGEQLPSFDIPQSQQKKIQSAWKRWADEIYPKVYDTLYEQRKSIERHAQTVSDLQDLCSDLTKIQVSGVNWVIERSLDKVVITPLWVGPLCEQELFRGIRKVVLTSATLSESLAKYMNIDDYEYLEMGSRFSYQRRPIIYSKFHKDRKGKDKKVCLKWKSSQEDKLLIVDRIDEIIEQRSDRKGIIIPPSYALSEFISEHSRWSRQVEETNSLWEDPILITHKRKQIAGAVKKFLSRKDGAVLCSPVIGEGFDFKDDQCRYAIIPKIPMVPLQSAVMKRRAKLDPDYGNYLTALQMVQYVGRLMRGPNDWGEIIILDGNWEWFLRGAEFAKWFLRACVSVKGLPEPMKEPKSERAIL